jgi:phosphate transport system substrate-binding protein
MLRQGDWWKYILLIFILSACRQRRTDPTLDTKDKGVINVSADESFKPVIEAQREIYEADHPEAKINIHYKPEADCLNDLYVDSVRLIIATKYISKKERAFIVDSMQVAPEQMLLAYDAVAIIVHPNEEITRFTMKDIREILQGRFKKNLIPVFDGLKATSTLSFIVDSVLRGD